MLHPPHFSLSFPAFFLLWYFFIHTDDRRRILNLPWSARFCTSVPCFISSSRSHTFPCASSNSQEAAGSSISTETLPRAISPLQTRDRMTSIPPAAESPLQIPTRSSPVRSPWIMAGSYFRLLNPSLFLVDLLHWSRRHRNPSLALTWPKYLCWDWESWEGDYRVCCCSWRCRGVCHFISSPLFRTIWCNDCNVYSIQAVVVA